MSGLCEQCVHGNCGGDYVGRLRFWFAFYSLVIRFSVHVSHEMVVPIKYKIILVDMHMKTLKKMNRKSPGPSGLVVAGRSHLKGGAAVLCVVVSGWSAGPVQAVLPAAVPGAGALGNTLPSVPQPALPADTGSLTLPALSPSVAGTSAQSGRSIVLRRVNIDSATGASGMSALSGQLMQRLQAIADSHTGIPQQFTDLQVMAQAMTRECHAHGLVLAQVVLPPQRIEQGVLVVTVYPGLLGEARISNTSQLSDGVARRMMSSGLPAGRVPVRDDLERTALLLGEIPGVQTGLILHPGQSTGSTQTEVSILTGKRFGGYIGMDNAGTSSTGRSRVMAGAYASELLGQGDQLKLDMTDAWEKSGLINGALDYSMLVGGYGTRVGMNYSHLDYHYYLQELRFEGYSDTAGAYVSHPWVRTPRTAVDVRLEAGVSQLTDRYPSLFSDITGGDRGKKRVTTTSLGVRGSTSALVPDGVTTFSLQGMLGNLNMQNDVARYWSSTDLLNSSGTFGRINGQFTHEQHLTGPLSVYGAVNGQWASKNLDSSQKFLTGGPTTVRAYAAGTGAVDDGAVSTAELRGRWMLPARWGIGEGHQFTIAGFYDQSWGNMYHNNTGLTSQNVVRLAGGGIYAGLARGNDYSLMLTWAHRTGDKDVTSGLTERDQFWVSAMKAF